MDLLRMAEQVESITDIGTQEAVDLINAIHTLLPEPKCVQPPNYLTSLDAAMTLVPEGMQLAIYTNFVLTRGFPQEPDGSWIITDDMPKGCWVRSYGDEPFRNVRAEALTTALAIAAFALKARVTQEPRDGE